MIEHIQVFMRRISIVVFVLLLTMLACNGEKTPPIPPTPENSVFDIGRTTYGFFPSPPETSLESVFATYKGMGQHGDFVLLQQNTDWKDFVKGVDGKSQTRADIINQVTLARQNNIDYIFVIDALNGLNRREFMDLPPGWEANFANPNVRTAYKNFTLWVLRSFHPRYLGLASEINTYMDAYPDDAENFISLYNELYALIKAESLETKVFVTFQWDDLNNMFPQPEEGNRQRMSPNWDQVEAFEPNLDVWAISTYPYFAFSSGLAIPADYYTPLLARTDKPVAIAESGFSSHDIGPLTFTPADQLMFLDAVHNQLGSRLVFWVNTLFSDFNLDSYAKELKRQGRDPQDSQTLGAFAYIGLQNADGSPKPAMEVWDEFRKGK